MRAQSQRKDSERCGDAPEGPLCYCTLAGAGVQNMFARKVACLNAFRCAESQTSKHASLAGAHDRWLRQTAAGDASSWATSPAPRSKTFRS